MRRVRGEKLLLTYRHACLVREFGGTEYCTRVPSSANLSTGSPTKIVPLERFKGCFGVFHKLFWRVPHSF